MVEVVFKPIEKIIIYEIIPSEFEEFIEIFAQPPNVHSSARWIDGILFTFRSLPVTEDNVADRMKGIVHWESFNYTKMETYKPQLINKAKNGVLYVINNSNNKTVRDTIKVLKKLL